MAAAAAQGARPDSGRAATVRRLRGWHDREHHGAHAMQTATVNDTTLAYERHGEGEPVVPNTTDLLRIQNPGSVGEVLAAESIGERLLCRHRPPFHPGLLEDDRAKLRTCQRYRLLVRSVPYRVEYDPDRCQQGLGRPE